jgi:hypothetical protein
MRRKHAVPRPVDQAFALHARFREAKAKVKPTVLVWTGDLQPTPLSRTYRIEITYLAGRVPKVRVIDPPLESRPGETLPHVYAGGTLCLHLDGEWTSDMLIVDTTVPWTSEWLINYEIWKATGEWHGGGEWPPRREGDADTDAFSAENTTIELLAAPRYEMP